MASYELMIQTHFSASHALRGYPGDCARLHGHNWKVKLYLKCSGLDETGIAIDYKILKQHLKEALSEWDHFHLNDIPPFDQINPTSENVARILYKKMAKRLDDGHIRVSRLAIGETCSTEVTYWPD